MLCFNMEMHQVKSPDSSPMSNKSYLTASVSVSDLPLLEVDGSQTKEDEVRV